MWPWLTAIGCLSMRRSSRIRVFSSFGAPGGLRLVLRAAEAIDVAVFHGAGRIHQPWTQLPAERSSRERLRPGHYLLRTRVVSEKELLEAEELQFAMRQR